MRHCSVSVDTPVGLFTCECLDFVIAVPHTLVNLTFVFLSDLLAYFLFTSSLYVIGRICLLRQPGNQPFSKPVSAHKTKLKPSVAEPGLRDD